MDDASAPASASAADAAGQPLRLLAFAIALLCGVAALIATAWQLAGQPQVDLRRLEGAQGGAALALAGAPLPGAGRELAAIRGAAGDTTPVDALILHRSPRWIASDAERDRHAALHAAASAAVAQGRLGLVLADGSEIVLPAAARGLAGIGAPYWLLAGFALLLYLATVVMLLSRLSSWTLLFALIGLCQTVNLALAAIEAGHGLVVPDWLLRRDLPLRMTLDLVSAAAVVHAASLLLARRRPAEARAFVAAAWLAAALLGGLAIAARLEHAWWWAQGGVALLGAFALWLLHRAGAEEPHPQAHQMRSVGAAVLLIWLLVTLALAASERADGAPHPAAEVLASVWYVFLASLLMLVPLFLRTRQVVREFALLAAIGTIALALDMLLVALFGLGRFVALALSLFAAIVLYAGARRWILDQLLGSSRLTTERMFDQLYRIAREVDAHPRRVPAMLLQLLRDLFEPLHAKSDYGASAPQARIADDGSTLVVPIAGLGGEPGAAPTQLRLRYAKHGRRVFTREDARLADRVVEQLRRAVAFDHAVEQGRREERLRLAQDLHDDIGARLLTLMYKAPSPELEEYLRHTLKDLKTLTRGLAASDHRLGDAAAEWKADLSHRLTAADIALAWDFSADRDLVLGVVQWSGLTRILRELVSNVIAHARATRVDVAMELAGEAIRVTVADNGVGADPRSWTHGLGLGGVRKRVKQIGGEVRWELVPGGGVACHVRLDLAPAAVELLSDGVAFRGANDRSGNGESASARGT